LDFVLWQGGGCAESVTKLECISKRMDEKLHIIEQQIDALAEILMQQHLEIL